MDECLRCVAAAAGSFLCPSVWLPGPAAASHFVNGVSVCGGADRDDMKVSGPSESRDAFSGLVTCDSNIHSAVLLFILKGIDSHFSQISYWVSSPCMTLVDACRLSGRREFPGSAPKRRGCLDGRGPGRGGDSGSLCCMKMAMAIQVIPKTSLRQPKTSTRVF